MYTVVHDFDSLHYTYRFRSVLPVVAGAVVALAAGAFFVVADLMVPITVRLVAGAAFVAAALDAVVFLTTVPVLDSLV